jgi:hypothetical protein
MGIVFRVYCTFIGKKMSIFNSLMEIFGLENKFSLNGIEWLLPSYHCFGAPDNKLLFLGFQTGIREGARCL